MGSLSGCQGYDTALFLVKPPEYLHCTSCTLVLRRPLMIIRCGHKICSPCFQHMQDDSVQQEAELRCPIDQLVVELTDVCEDIAMQRVVASLGVRCQRHDQGCSWTGVVQELDDHKKQCVAEAEEVAKPGTNDTRGCLDSARVKELYEHLELCYEEISVLKQELAEQRVLNGDVQFERQLQHHQLQQHHEQLNRHQQQLLQQQKRFLQQQKEHQQQYQEQQCFINNLTTTVEKLKESHKEPLNSVDLSTHKERKILGSIDNTELPLLKSMVQQIPLSMVSGYDLPPLKETKRDVKLKESYQFLPRALKRKKEPLDAPFESNLKEEEVSWRDVGVQHQVDSPDCVIVSDGRHSVQFTSLATISAPSVYSRAIKLLSMVSSSPSMREDS